MNCETAQKLLETLEGREILVVCKAATGGGMAGYNLAGTLKRGPFDGVWELYRVGLDPSEHPQVAKSRSLKQYVAAEDVGAVTELGDVSAVSPAAIFRPGQPGGGGGVAFR